MWCKLGGPTNKAAAAPHEHPMRAGGEAHLGTSRSTVSECGANVWANVPACSSRVATFGTTAFGASSVFSASLLEE